jgi:hypothetical protein
MSEVKVVMVGVQGPQGVGYTQVTSSPAVSSSNVTPGRGVSFLINQGFVGAMRVHILGAHVAGNQFNICINTSSNVSNLLIYDGAGTSAIQFSSADATAMTNLSACGRILFSVYDDGSNYIGAITANQ